MILTNVGINYIFLVYLKYFIVFFFEGELATRLSQFGPVRIEWPAENNRTRRRTNHGMIFFENLFELYFVFVGKSGYAYAIFDKESSVHELLLACCQQPQRNSDGRCEYYLNLNSQRSASKRKSVCKSNIVIMCFYSESLSFLF
jgi:hypothetical protein